MSWYYLLNPLFWRRKTTHSGLSGLVTQALVLPGLVSLVLPWSLRADDPAPGSNSAKPPSVSAVAAGSGWVTNQFTAFAQVAPAAVLPLRAAQTGVVQNLCALPGSSVLSNQPIASLEGPEIKALLDQAASELAGAQTNFINASLDLKIQQQQLASHLATRQAVAQSGANLAQAQSALALARAHLDQLRQMVIMRSPVDGSVLSVSVANGERVNPGDPLVVIQPAGSLWLSAAFHGADAPLIHTGMTGVFFPDDHAEPVPVTLSSVACSLAPDGGLATGARPSNPSAKWMAGQMGMLVLFGTAYQAVTVPTRALILDQGRWWVLVHEKDGNHPRQVVPGPVRGWNTAIQQGLAPGEQVMVDDAFLEYHRNIADSYQSPD